MGVLRSGSPGGDMGVVAVGESFAVIDRRTALTWRVAAISD